MQTILGAGGAIGTELLSQLAERGRPVRLASRHPKPAAGADSNMVMYLVARTGEAGAGAIVWLTYAVSPRLVSPQPVISANMRPEPQGRVVHVVVAEAVGPETVFRLYRADATKRIASLPLSLDPERKEEWPEPSRAESELKYSAPRGSACVVASVDVTPASSGVSIHARREPTGCAALRVTFEPLTGRWSEVVVQPESKQ